MINIIKGMKWTQFGNTRFPGQWFRHGALTVCVARENGLWHMSISHPNRHPSWGEIYTAWYNLVPDAATISGAIILPRKTEYVNLHEHCFHIHQLTDSEVGDARIVF